MEQRPDYRLQVVREAVDQAAPAPTESLSAALYALLKGDPCPHPAVEYAWDLYNVPNHRAALDAFLLAGVEVSRISSVLEIQEGVVATYRDFFMDTSVFRNRLERMSYAQNYEGDAHGQELVRAAVTVGLEYLLWAFGAPDRDRLDNKEVVRRTMIDSFMRGLAHKGNAVTSATAKEALKWWGTAIRNAQILEDIDPKATRQAYEELRMALEKHDPTYTVETSPVKPEDVLH